MHAHSAALSIGLSAFLAASLSAQAPQKPEAPKSDIQPRAEALMDRARHLSDIRAKNAPAFRLKATFSFVGKNLENFQGTYTEVWVSDSQWRRETVVENFHRVQVGTSNRTWTLDNSKDFPETATRLPALMNIFPLAPARFEFKSITDITDQKPAETCATTQPGSQQEQYRFCFDQKSGALLANLSPDIRPKGTSDYSCLYGIFRKFGDSWFPREMACLEDKHRTLEAKVDELTAEPSPDAALFTPPPGAIELGRCSGKLIQPYTAVSREMSSGTYGVSAEVALSFIVDTKGKPQEIEISQSGGKEFDHQAQNYVAMWSFKPGTCDGEPMPMTVNVTLKYNSLPMTGQRRYH
jgi:TonB family protein